MAGTTTGVYPVFKNVFKIDTTGGTSETSNLKTIADMENFSVSIDGNVEEWKPFDQEGWTRRLVTGKALTVSVSGKRNIGDAGNDYVAGLALKTGADSHTTVVWTFPSGATLTIPCVINVTEWESGDSTAVAPLAFDIMSDGKPEYTPAEA